MQSSRLLHFRASIRSGGGALSRKSYHCSKSCGIGFVPCSPLGRGFLTGKMDASTTFASSDFRHGLPRFSPEAIKANQALVEVLRNVAAQYKGNPGTDRAGLAVGAATVDRADSRHHEVVAPR